MVEKAVIVENLGKKFYIGERLMTRQSTAGQVLNTFLAPVRRASKLIRGQETGASELNKEFWALRNISFEVNSGEILGIIGHNGAGKSTLLKLLSNITAPSEGKVLNFGRVAALLEVGAGFHHELTGRENIYLSGTIMGMNRREIDRKFDEIVDFAEVEKFIDTPVKHYSSGMYVRLGFSMAAHLETDILIIDEVLAVGDIAFQKKCFAKIEGVSQSGRTILFVSHSMNSISRLCSRAILLNQGGLAFDGLPHETIRLYLQSDTGTTASREWKNATNPPGSTVVQLRSVSARTESGIISEAFDIRKPIIVEMEYDVLESGHTLSPNFHFYNQEAICIFVSTDLDYEGPRQVGRYKTKVLIPGNLLTEGFVIVGAAITTYASMQVHFFERDAISFQVVDSLDGDSARGTYAGDIPGVVRPMLKWENQYSTFNDSSSVGISSTLSLG